MTGKERRTHRGAKPTKAGVSRKSRKNDSLGVRDLQKRLAESLEQQTATAEILRVISSSPTELQPVLDAVAESAARLCAAYDALIFRLDGDVLRRAAHSGPIPAPLGFVIPATRSRVTGRAVLTRQPVQVADALAKSEEFPETKAFAREHGFRTILSVPLLREGIAIGTIDLRRTEVRPFNDAQIALLKTFADQAVIAIENVRLFTELQEKNRALTQAHAQVSEALEQQTATSEILRVISSSPTDVQPVFEAIAASAVRLCGAVNGAVFRFDGELIHIAAYHNISDVQLGPWRRQYPATLESRVVTARAILSRAAVQVEDLTNDPWLANTPVAQAGYRTVLSVPMIRDGLPIGAVNVTRMEVRPFSTNQVALLQTFADQAVIAIENVRLFNETKEALERQTATSEILGVISRSPTDTQPVFDAIAANAARLCSANDAQVLRVERDVLRLVAAFGAPSMPSVRQLTRGHLVGRAVIDRKTIHVRDLAQAMAEYPETTAARYGVQSALAVPLLREGVALGVIRISRTEVQPFTDSQIALLQTFADQAVIAIENVRLFTELQEKNRALTTAHAQVTETLEQQTATSDILRVISKSPTDLQPVFDPLLDSAVRLCGATHASLYRLDGDVLHHVAARGAIQGPRPVGMTGPIPHGTAPGRAILTAETVQVMDAQAEVAGMPPDAQDYVRRAGVRTVLAVPLLREGSPIGVIVVRRTEVRPFAENEMRLLRTFADQAVIAIENVRLFKELEVANLELAAASQHKSEFLANMSHELRTPLNAIIGFSEVLADRMFGDLNEKQEEYLKDIYASGTHLLSLINDILDLSKIEAGRMELELSDFHLPTALDNALTLVRERAGRRTITLQMSVDERVGEVQADERKVRQVVLNLLSNAIKFTPEGGRIEVAAAPRDGFVEVSVSDTGVGIAPEDQEAVFEEFRQVGTAEKKAEGTGLGLTLCRKFIELHGGRIWVKSQLGQGSTFTFTIPVPGQ